MNFNPRGWLKNKDLYKYLAAIPIPVFIILIAILSRLDISVVFEPPLLLFILNTVFIFAVFLSVSYISARSYLAGGSLNILLLGCGMLVFGSGSLLAGLLVGAPGGTNLSVTIFNIASLAGSIIHFAGAILTLIGVNPELEPMRRKLKVIISYLGVLAFMVFLLIADLQGSIPLFFIQGVGPTILRQIVLGTAVILFSVSALLFMRLYLQSKENFLYWYSLALMLIDIGLSGVFFQSAVGSPASWAGRSAQYLGGIYFFIAILSTIRKARTKGIPLEKTIATFFREPEANFRALVETANDAIVSFDNEGRVLMWNSAAEKIFSYNRSEAVGSILSGLIIPDSCADIIKKETENITLAEKSTQIRKTIEMVAKNKGGKEFPVEFSVSARKTSDGWMYTGIIRDVTERKRAEEALLESEKRFKVIAETTPVGIGIVDIPERKFLYVNGAYEKAFGYAPGELLGRKTQDIYYDLADRDRILRVLKEKGNAADYEVKLKKKDGTAFLGMASARPIIYVGKSALLGTFIDITDIKRVEQALRESEERYRRLFGTMQENFSLMEVITDEQGCPVDYRFLEVNTALERYSGKSREQLVGHKHSDFMAAGGEAAEQKWFDIICKVGLTGKEESGEHYAISTGRWAQFHAFSPLHGQCAVISMDITDRKRAEEALQQSEERFSKAFQSSPVALNIARLADGCFVDVNESFLRMFEYSREEVIDHISTELNMYVDPDEHDQFIRILLEQGTIRNYEVTLRTKIGKPIRVLFSAEMISLNGQDHIISTLVDITERKRAEEALQKAHDELELRVQERTAELSYANKTLLTEIAEHKQAEEKIREQATLLDNAQEAIGVRSLEHNLIYWNKGAQRLYGWTAEEAIGKNPIEFLFKDKEEPPQLIEAKRIVLEKGEWTGELNQVTKDGRNVIVESHWTLIYDSEGKPKSILVVNTDITEKKMFEAQLLRAQRMESIGILAGGIAHNLNNMLTPMMMSLRMLKNKLKDEQSQKLLNILENNSQRSADLIKQVLSFSRGVEGERNPLQIKHLISEIEKVAKETFPRNIEIRTDIPKDLFTISGDATQLHQVIMNLCVNARDAMPDGGILSITASNFSIDENYARMHNEAKVGSYVAISVSDTGIGIPPKILDRIFEPFFTTKEFGKGTGLGLSTSLAIVKSHGGFINVESEIGKGTTFRVYLPATLAEMQKGEEEKLEFLGGNGELVLVAEDEDSVREVTISTLEAHGYRVLAANDGADAVALYAQNKDKIKVVLMDMMMPVMDGQASIRAIRKINPDVKVIVVSGLAEKDKLAKIESTRAQAILPKPYTAEKLLKTVHEVLGSK